MRPPDRPRKDERRPDQVRRHSVPSPAVGRKTSMPVGDCTSPDPRGAHPNRFSDTEDDSARPSWALASCIGPVRRCRPQRRSNMCAHHGTRRALQGILPSHLPPYRWGVRKIDSNRAAAQPARPPALPGYRTFDERSLTRDEFTPRATGVQRWGATASRLRERARAVCGGLGRCAQVSERQLRLGGGLGRRAGGHVAQVHRSRVMLVCMFQGDAIVRHPKAAAPQTGIVP